MYPKEYDGLAVLQGVRIAYDTRDRAQDKVSEQNGLIVATGSVPMVDNVTPMNIRMLLDPGSEKIISAFPLAKTGSVMRLGEEALQHLIYGEGASVAMEKPSQ
jgi:hypothetical protein